MPPSIQHAIRMTDGNTIVILDDDDDDVRAADPLSYYYQSSSNNRREESTSLTSLPPAFNPEFLGVDHKKKSSSLAATMAPVSIQTVDQVQQGTASSPITVETVHPFIAAVFTCGFEDVHVDDDDEEDFTHNDFSPRPCLDESILTERTVVSPNDRLEKRFIQEPRRHKAAGAIRDGSKTASSSVNDDTTTVTESTTHTTTSGTATSMSSSATTASSATMVPPLMVPAVTGHEVPPQAPRDGTKANPPSAPRFIPLTQHQSHYDRLKPYAQLLVWKTQLHTRAALERGLRIHQKHGPTVKKVAKKSWKALRKASQKSIAFAGHHGPIVGRRLKRASIQGVENIKEYEAEHQLLAKSKSGIYNVWRRQRGTRASF